MTIMQRQPSIRLVATSGQTCAQSAAFGASFSYYYYFARSG
jgi:hypothetical protein